MLTKESRLKYLDIASGIMIVWLLIYHALYPMYEDTISAAIPFLYFFMPYFFYKSGMMFQIKDVKSLFIKDFKKLMIIFINLFEEYGLYDENLKIVSDWKWYLQAIGLGRVKPEYVDIDVTIFDDGGISETNLALRNKERRQVLEELLPPAVLWDYDTHAFEMEQMNRLRRWKLYPLVYFIERGLSKLEKWLKLLL